jgi:hypothetical protein
MFLEMYTGTYVIFFNEGSLFRNISKTFEPILFKTIFAERI